MKFNADDDMQCKRWREKEMKRENGIERRTEAKRPFSQTFTLATLYYEFYEISFSA